MNKEIHNQKYAIMEKILETLSPLYTDEQSTEVHKSFLATVVGAGIFYLPSGKDFYSGKISIVAYQKIVNGEICKLSQLTKEHKFPRKIAGSKLLSEQNKKETKSFRERYEMTYGRYHFVTPEENRALRVHQNERTFENEELAYENAGIELIEKTYEELSNIIKSNKNEGIC